MSFNIGVSSLLSNQAALQVVGHNIANANTPGFSRQTVSLQQVPGQQFGNGYFGRGVQVAGVERAFNQFLTREANLTAAASEASKLRYQRLQALEALFPMGASGLGQQLNGFLNSWADAVASPTNQTARGVVLTRADDLARRLNGSAEQLEQLRATARTQLDASLTQINQLSTGIANMNQRIVDGFAAGVPPNDLLDQRDRLLADLNRIVQVHTLEADDRSMTVFVGGSMPLVMGSRATALVGSESISPDGRYTVGFGNAATVLNDDLIGGGALRGALSFFNDDVAGVSNQLGRMALATLELTNRQHRQGLDANGNPGQDFFRPLAASYWSQAVVPVLNTVVPPTALAVSMGIDPAPDAPTQFQASDYRITFTGAGAGSLTRLSDGHSVAFTAPATDLTLDGLRFGGLNTGAAGTEVLLRPFRGAAAAMAVNLTSPSQLALSSPVVAVAAAGNSGNLQVEALHRPAGQAPPFALPATINFVAGGYTINAGPVQAFGSGQAIVGSGFALTLRGAPTVGDSFVVRAPLAGEDLRQNAGNGQALLALRDLAAIDGFKLSDGYIPVFSAVAANLQLAQTDAEFHSRLALNAEGARANQAGVNLDEEAVRLLQFQQAYQASARYLQSIQSIFETLLASFGR